MSELKLMQLVEKASSNRKEFKRKIFYEVQEKLKQKNVVFLAGPRKCGKTVCLEQLNRETENSTLINFKTLSDNASVNKIDEIIDSVVAGESKVYLLDEVTYAYHPEEELARIADAYTHAVANGIKAKTKIVLTGSQSIALKVWGLRAFCNQAGYVESDFLDYAEWLEYKNRNDVSEESFREFVLGTKDFYNFSSIKEYLEGCLLETVISNDKSKNLVLGNECDGLSSETLVDVLFGAMYSLHNRVSVNTFFKEGRLEDSIKYLIQTNQVITSISTEEVKEKVAKSFVGRFTKINSMDAQSFRKALLFLERCGLITLTPVFNNFTSSMDVVDELIRYDTRLLTKDDIFKTVNFTIRYPMFYLEVLKDVLGDLGTELRASLLGSIVECYVRGILPSDEGFEYNRDGIEVDYVNLKEILAVEISVANKRGRDVNLDEVPSLCRKILLTNNQEVSTDSIRKIPYYDFVFSVCKKGLQSI